MTDPITRWQFAGIVALSLLIAILVYLYTDSDSLALLGATLVGAAAMLLIHHYHRRSD
jgi:positive regulator of sigma E activity